MNRPTNISRLQWLGRPFESPVRDYVWGIVIAACGVLAIMGTFFLFGG